VGIGRARRGLKFTQLLLKKNNKAKTKPWPCRVLRAQLLQKVTTVTKEREKREKVAYQAQGFLENCCVVQYYTTAGAIKQYIKVGVFLV
jgi:hypothetical protein